MARQALASGKKVVCIVIPTGGGKTHVISEISRLSSERGKRVFILAHRRKLVHQISERLRLFGVSHNVLMHGSSENCGSNVTVGSRDTLMSRVYDLECMSIPEVDVVIVDEMRHGHSGAYRTLLDEMVRRGAKLVGMDATPATPEGLGLGPWVEELIIPVTVSELVREGLLLPVRCYAPDREVKVVGGKTVVGGGKGIVGDLVESWKKYAENLPTVLFVSRVQYSKEAVELFNQSGIPAAHVDAETPDDERERIFEGMESGKYKVLSNVGILTEGTDLTCLGCVQFFMDPGSRVGFIQRAGRVLRPHPGQSYAVLIDHAGAVFRYGFPDEDMDWPLEGDANEKWEERKRANRTEQTFYCPKCEFVYQRKPGCPLCGEKPGKPPRSIFDAPDINSEDGILVPVGRDLGKSISVFSEGEKRRHWVRCLSAAAKRGGSFWMAAMIFKKKYGHLPESEYPFLPPMGRKWRVKVTEEYPWLEDSNQRWMLFKELETSLSNLEDFNNHEPV